MRLCAIIISWGDVDLTIQCDRMAGYWADGVILINSEYSNYGEKEERQIILDSRPGYANTFYWEPDLKKQPRDNETAKRNFGLEKARELGYTHFLMLDNDEMYLPKEINDDKKRFDDPNLLGLVGRVKCYFRSPTLTIGYDTTLVPLIHKITPNLIFEFNKNYPFAWTSKEGIPFTDKKQIRIDPTRSMNINSGVEWSETTMHHASWIRSDIKKKIRNSTARENIERSTILQDYLEAKPGYFCKFYGKTLTECENIFSIPEIIDNGIHSSLQT